MKQLEKQKIGFTDAEPGTAKAIGDRRIMFVMSDETPDRDGDVLKLDGWELENFLKNPVFPPMHSREKYPLGRWEKVWGEGGQLRGIVAFADESTHPEADLAYSLYKQGIMNAVSVRFAGIEYEPNDYGGVTFTRQELLECSAVPVPGNANALVLAKGYDKETRALFLKGCEDGPDAAGEEADEAKADVAPERTDEGPIVSEQSYKRMLAILNMED